MRHSETQRDTKRQEETDRPGIASILRGECVNIARPHETTATGKQRPPRGDTHGQENAARETHSHSPESRSGKRPRRAASCDKNGVFYRFIVSHVIKARYFIHSQTAAG